MYELINALIDSLFVEDEIVYVNVNQKEIEYNEFN
tara:strand:+ start:43 stop:147 length:105 start_codon:yes stop_codon:yes gene_type:complete